MFYHLSIIKRVYLKILTINMGLLMLKRLQSMSLLFTLLLSTNLLAKLNLDYPELLVVPKATTRLLQEVQRQDKKLFFNWGVSASATTTLIASIFQMGNVDITQDEKETSPKVGMAVGAFWLGTNAFLAYKYKGYLSALRHVKRMPGKTKSQRLAKETMQLKTFLINLLGMKASRKKLHFSLK